jgi:hypothetical protein
LCGGSVGLFHSGVEVCGQEWAFGASEGGGSGMFALRPREAAELFGHRHHSAIELGSVAQGVHLRQVLRELEREWRGDSYDLLTRNCNNFSDALCERLGLLSARPPWVNRLARIGRRLIAVAACLQRWV